MSRTLPGLVLMLAFVAGACGDGIHSASNLGEPLEVLQARVEGRLPEGIAPQRLSASLIWESFPAELSACIQQADDVDDVFACTTPEDFRSTLSSDSIPIQPAFPAAFEIPIHTLPSPRVLSGDAATLFGLGVLVVYEDGNSNDRLDLVAPEAIDSPDTVLAAGIAGDGQDATFVVYREGGLSPLFRLFEPFECPEPGQGFSVLSIREISAAERVCTVQPAGNTSMDVVFEDSRAVRELICEPPPAARTFPAEPPPSGSEVDCHFHDSLEFVIDPSRYCQQVQRYDLVGCEQVVGCAQPDWDLEETPPAWWPCTGESDGGFSVTDDLTVVSSRPDRLFSVRYDEGDETFALDEIELWVRVNPTEIVVFTHPGVILFIDEDGDSLFSSGDTLEAFEPIGTNFFDSNHLNKRFKVSVEQSTDLVRVKTLAELTWFSRGLTIVD